MTVGFDLKRFRETGVEVVRDFFEPEVRERFAELGRRIGDETRRGNIKRSAQFIGGFDLNVGAEAAQSDALRAMAVEALGENACCLISRVLMKDSTFTGSIEAHQDWPYFGGDTRKINVFVPLTRCWRENGMLVFYEGSHTVGPVERGTIDVDRFPQFPPVCPDLRVGDVLFADFLTWHASVPATIDDDRILFQVVLQPASDRSSNDVFGKGWQDLGQTYQLRTTAMLNARPTVGINYARQLMGSGFEADAKRMALGLSLDSPDNVEAALLLHDLAVKAGEDARPYLDAAEAALERLRVQIAELKGVPAAEPEPVGPSQAEVDHRLAEHAAAEARLRAEIDHLSAELEAVRASTSWRITQPLRRLRGGKRAS